MSLALLLVAVSNAHAGADVGGYVRVMGRPDLEGGAGRLGTWNLYGRLLNEGPYAALDLRVDLQEPALGSDRPWSALHLRAEGGSVAGADPGMGSLAAYRMSQAYVLAGNTLLRHVEWRVGTLDYSMGDLGLYDLKPAQLFQGVLGTQARLDTAHVEWVVGAGDKGFTIRPDSPSPVLTAGSALRLRVGKHLELGGGGQGQVEPSVQGSTNALYQTPGVRYEDYVRGEVVAHFLDENPDMLDRFPDPESVYAVSGKGVGYLGFGGWGAFVWDNVFVSYERLHPDRVVTESADGVEVPIYVAGLTDERTRLTVGHQLELHPWPDHLEFGWGALYGNDNDGDNDIAPSDADRWYASTVLRAQQALNPTVAILLESSVAREVSKNGNAYRQHADSILANTDGVPDSRGLEWGDTNTRDTWQGKGGVVLQPLGPGLWSRPSLRFLYGVQHSNVNNAFANTFVETVDQWNDFGNVERHWHHLVAAEAEVWF